MNVERILLAEDSDLDSLEIKFPRPLRRLLESCKALMLRQNNKESTASNILKSDETVDVYYGIANEDTTFVTKSVGTNDFAKALRFKEILTRDRCWIEWCLKIDENAAQLPVLKIVFTYLPKLNIVVTESELLPSIIDQRRSRLSDLMLRGENVLSFLTKGDNGFENPNPRSQHHLVHARVHTFSELALIVGYPYKWAQTLCNLRFDRIKPVSFINRTSETKEMEPVDQKIFGLIVQRIFERFRTWSASWKEIQATEIRSVTAKYINCKPWIYIDQKELEQSFRICEDLVTMQLVQADRRFFAVSYKKKYYDVRIVAIFQREFPIELPVLALEVVDKRGPVPNFVDNDIIVDMVRQLNVDRYSNEGTALVKQNLQLIKLMFYVDELLQAQTFHKFRSPMPTLPIQIPRKNGIVFGRKSAAPSNSPPSSLEGVKRRKLFTSASHVSCNTNKIRPGPKSKTRATSTSTDITENRVEEAIKNRRVSERSSKSKTRKRTIQERESVVHINDESAIMDVNDVIGTSKKYNFPNEHDVINTEWGSDAPSVEVEVEVECVTEEKSCNEFQFSGPSAKKKPKIETEHGRTECLDDDWW